MPGRVGRVAAVLGPLMVIDSAVRPTPRSLWALRARWAADSRTGHRRRSAAHRLHRRNGQRPVTLSAPITDSDRLGCSVTTTAKGRVTLTRRPQLHLRPRYRCHRRRESVHRHSYRRHELPPPRGHRPARRGGHTARSTIAVQIPNPRRQPTRTIRSPSAPGSARSADPSPSQMPTARSRGDGAGVDQPARATGVVVSTTSRPVDDADSGARVGRSPQGESRKSPPFRSPRRTARPRAFRSSSRPGSAGRRSRRTPRWTVYRSAQFGWGPTVSGIRWCSYHAGSRGV